MKLRYFASVRDQVGVGAEDVTVPAGVATVADLMAWLSRREGGYAQAFAGGRVVRAAVNQEHAQPGTPVGPADEVGFFPPVTGG